MRLPKFAFIEPKSIQEACSILENEPNAKVLGGGTDLLVNMKHRVERPTTVVNIKGIRGLDDIRKQNNGTRIGALTPLKRLYETEFIAESFPGLAQAASSVGSYHHQVMGTLGGNICQQNRCKYFNQSQWWRSARATCYKAGGAICHVVNKEETCYSCYSGDLAPALLVLNTRIVLEGSGGRREISLEALFAGDGKDPLTFKTGEILTEIVIPEDSARGLSCYTKFANRESIDFPIVGLAYWASPETRENRIAYTAVDRKPLRAGKVEQFLGQRGLSESTIEEAATLVSKEATPVNTSLYPPSYKRRIMELLFRKTSQKAMGDQRYENSC